MANLIIKGNDFRKGESSDDYAQDGGFSPDSYAINLTAKRGEMSFSSWNSVGGATLTGNIVAGASDENYLGNDLYYVDDEGAFYTHNASTFTKRQTAGGSNVFSIGTTDMLQFKLVTFATSNIDVIKLTGSDLTAIDSTWWSSTLGNSPLSSNFRHPLEKVEGTMYIGDGAKIHTWDGTSSVESAIVLPDSVAITSLRKHPNGVNLIAFCGISTNFSHANGTEGRAYIIDPVTLTWIREIQLDAQVEGSRLYGGVVIVTYGQNIGYFTGDGIQFLKKMKTSTTTYSQNIKNVEDMLVFRDGLEVLMYGDLGLGKAWWRPFRSNNSQAINYVGYKGGNIVVAGYSDGAGGGVLAEIDLDDGTGAGGQFVSNRYFFEDEVLIKGVDVLHEISNTAGTTIFNLYSRDTEDVESLIHNANYVSQGAKKTRIRYDEKLDIFQLMLKPSNDTIKYKMIRVPYE